MSQPATGAVTGPVLLAAFERDVLLTAALVAVTLAVLLVTSGAVTRLAFRYAGVEVSAAAGVDEDTGRTIGKLENVLVLGLMLLQAYTALGVIFAAKSLVRRVDMGTGDTSYYLTGTLANFTYSVVVGLALHVVLALFVVQG